MRTMPRIFKTWQHCCSGPSIPDGAAIRFLIMSGRAHSHLYAHACFVEDSSNNGMTCAKCLLPKESPMLLQHDFIEVTIKESWRNLGNHGLRHCLKDSLRNIDLLGRSILHELTNKFHFSMLFVTSLWPAGKRRIIDVLFVVFHK